MSKSEKVDYFPSQPHYYIDLPKKSIDVSATNENESAFATDLLKRLRKNSEIYSLIDNVGAEKVAYGLLTLASVDKNYQEIYGYDKKKMKIDMFIDREWESVRFKSLMAIARIINSEEGAHLLAKVAKIGATDVRHIQGFDEHVYSFSGNDENIISHLKLLREEDLYGGKYEQLLYSNWRPWDNAWVGVKFQPIKHTSLVKIGEDKYIAPVSAEKIQLTAVSSLGEMHMKNGSWGALHTVAATSRRFVTDYIYPNLSTSQRMQEHATDVLVESGMGSRKMLEDLRR